MITIFEGCDGAGKTTVAKAYADLVGARYVHFGPSKGVHNLSDIYIDAMVESIYDSKVHLVFDRSWLSEEPYGQVYRNGLDRLGTETVCGLNTLAELQRGVLVYCKPPLSNVIRSFKSRPEDEMLDTLDQLTDVYELYDVTIDKASNTIDTLYYDYTLNDFKTLVSDIERVRNTRSPSVDRILLTVRSTQLAQWLHTNKRMRGLK